MVQARNPRTELAIARSAAPEWHRLWLMLRARPWPTLALVPGGKDVASELMLSSAVLLSRTGAAHLRSPIHVADATPITLSTLGTLSQELEQCRQLGSPVLIALPSVIENPAALSIAQQAEATLLCTVRERTRLPDIEATIAEVGTSRIVGSIIFSSNTGAAIPPQ